jgi:GH35 family endo-1,4-beta-xylanase
MLALACAAAGAEPWKGEAVEKRIQQHRTARVAVSVVNAAGKPLANTEVTVQMVRHRFLFGCNAYKFEKCGSDKLNRLYEKRFSDLLNFATLPFYWGSYEPAPNKTNEKHIRRMAQWCRENNIRTKGHPLCWHIVEPKWITPKPLDEVEKLQLARIKREMTGFAGLIDTWDVLNEACVMPHFKYKGKISTMSKLCEKVGRAELIKKCFAQAVAANPKAELLLNDFNTGPQFEKLTAECLKAGVKIDAIGLQSHMHTKYRGAKWGWEVCERFVKFKKPLHFTELTILSGDLKTDNDWLGHRPGWNTTDEGEKRQAEQVVEFYKLLFSHPAVEAITWWDFSDLGAWQGAPAGLIRKDMSPKPAYTELMKLIKGEWWTGPLKLKTDAAGKVSFNGFLGTYDVTAGESKATFELEKGKGAVTVKLGN